MELLPFSLVPLLVFSMRRRPFPQPSQETAPSPKLSPSRMTWREGSRPLYPWRPSSVCGDELQGWSPCSRRFQQGKVRTEYRNRSVMPALFRTALIPSKTCPGPIRPEYGSFTETLHGVLTVQTGLPPVHNALNAQVYLIFQHRAPCVAPALTRVPTL